MNSRRKICIVTGSRAEYGLLYVLFKEIRDDEYLHLQIIATGMHLSPEFGLTYRQIEEDGFVIDEKIDMLLSSDNSSAITKSIGIGTIGFADSLMRLTPDILVVLGDRFEILAAAQAATIAGIPIAHIHGGELTEGIFDESIRHSITKMAQWHFVATEEYRKRVVQMGESPNRVFNFGAPGLDSLSNISWLSRIKLETYLNMNFFYPLFLVTYNPVTLDKRSPEIVFNELLAALAEFPDASIVFTYPNADTGGKVLIKCIDKFVAQNPKRIKVFVSLGQQRYLSLMREADVIIGNSSSGIIEAPALKKATVNIGDRQKGRLKASSVIDVVECKNDIVKGISLALSKQFLEQLPATESLYGCGGASEKIVAKLKDTLPSIQKAFFDIKHGY